MIVYVLSRDGAVKYCRQKHSKPMAIISIATPGVEYDDYPFVSEENQITEILNLSFCDADRPDTPDVYGTIVHIADMMTDEDAKKVVEFTERNKDKPIIVHCDAGISRSAGVGAAIMLNYNGNDAAIFDSRWFAPNMWCYYKVLKAFGYDYSRDGEIEADL